MPKKIKINGDIIGNGDAWIYDWLGMDYITPSILDQQLEEAAGEDIELYVNSPGGSVWDGGEMYVSLKEYPGKKIAKITGVAASAASFFVMAADEVHISPTGEMMIHNAASVTRGDKNDHLSGYNLLKSTDEGITNAYILKTGKSREELLDLMNKTTWMNAQEAVKNGFADSILFDEGKVLVTNSATPSGLTPEVIRRLKNKLLKEQLSIENRGNISAILTDSKSDDTIVNKEGNKPMDFKELQEKHPDLVNEIMTSAINAERSRIAALNDLADAPGAAPFIKDAITNGETAGDVAMKIIKASAERVKQEGENRLEDAQNSNVAAVKTKEPANSDVNDAAEEDAAIENMVKYATELINKKGGRF
ncbi:head maturation protease, ClpP-related [Paenibacillus sp. FSL M8-0142]|uniref:head maturation protease, ClpP-related n=1 Tax=Paenibacillus sp. FSL M8-0142 TaxID=2954525 RepID=UPI00315AD98F